jgi:hypothetical protein
MSWKYLFKLDNAALSCDYIISMHLTANGRKIQTTLQYIYLSPFQQIRSILAKVIKIGILP